MSIERVVRKKGIVYKVWYRDEAGRGRSRTFTQRKDAVLFEAEIKLKKQRGHLADIEGARQRFADLAEEWWVRDATPHLAPLTLRTYRWLLDRYLLPRLGNIRLQALRPNVVEGFRNELYDQRVGRETIRKALALLQTILRRSVISGALMSNPVAVIKKPSQGRQRQVRPLLPSSVESVRRWLLAQGRLSDATLVGVLAYAGLRPGEALALKWRDVGNNALFVSKAISLGQERGTKTGASRTVPLVRPLKADLGELFALTPDGAPDALVFPGPGGAAWTDTSYRNWRKRWFRTALEATGTPPVRPYDLRHSYASILLAQGLSPVEVAQRLGHAPTMTLDTYGHVVHELRNGSAGPDLERLIFKAREDTEALHGDERELTSDEIQLRYRIGAI